MELYKEILAAALRKGEVRVVFSGQDEDLNKIVESACYKALCEIREIISDKELDDKECFWRIEKIVRVFEEMGCGTGGRHDF